MSEFKEPVQSFAAKGATVTPYIRAQQEWDQRIGSARVQARNWRLLAFAAVALCFLLSGGLIFQSTKSMVTPYVVQVSDSGMVQAVGPAKQANYRPEEPVIRFFVGEFIKKSRSIPLDPGVAKENWISAYNFMEPAAGNKMTELIQKEDPLSKLGKETRQISINVMVPTGNNSWEVRWTETATPVGVSAQPQVYRMTGLFTVSVSEPKSEEALKANPLGLFIKDFSWSREM